MKELNSKKLRLLEKVFYVVGVVYVVFMIKSFITTISNYTSQGYGLSDVLGYLFEAQFLPNVILPLAIFAGFGIVFHALADIKDSDALVGEIISISDESDEDVEESVEETEEVVEEAEDVEVEETETDDVEVEEIVEEVASRVFENISYVGGEAKKESSLDNITTIK